MPLLLLLTALAADPAPYQRAVSLIEELYLYPEQVDRLGMFLDAGEQLEQRIEWLLVESRGWELRLSDGTGAWHTEVRLDATSDVPAALARLEDAVRAAGRPIDAEVDPRVEILRGMVHRLDRHSIVLHGSSLQRFDERLSGTLSGIGVSLQVAEGQLRIGTIQAESPAARGGLQPGDRVLRIDGLSTTGMDAADAGRRLRGPAGTPVMLTVTRAAEVFDLALTREAIKVRNVTSARGPDGVGVVRIEHFSEQTHAWLLRSLVELDESGGLAEGLILDVRGNTGGSLLQSADAVDTFVDHGRIVRTVGHDGGPVTGLAPEFDAHADASLYDGPVVVLMDRETASGSEILAGSLARMGRALLLGTPTFGKGTVQKVYEIAPGIKLKLTVAEYRLAGDERVTEAGLPPDLVLTEYHFGGDGVWYPEPGRERARVGAGTPFLPVVLEAPGWRPDGSPPDDRDDMLEVAARVVSAAEGSTRLELLDALGLLRSRLVTAADARLQEAFGLRGIDWSPAPAGAPPPTTHVRTRLEVDGNLAAGEAVTLIASVRNDGPDLYRAAVRLRSANRLWDDRVLPIGRLARGQAATGTVRIDIPRDSVGRADEVEVWLEAQELASMPVLRRTLRLEGSLPPALGGTVRLGADGEVSLELDNRGDLGLDGVVARFAFPEEAGVELAVPESAPVRLAPGERETTRLRLLLDPERGEAGVPLVLELEASDWGELGRWPVTLAADGRPQRLEPPTVRVDHPEVAPPGRATLVLWLADDVALDHVVVFAGSETVDRSRWEPRLRYEGDKLAWRPLQGRRWELRIEVPVEPGVNRYDVVVEDRTGLRTEARAYVLGRTGDEMADGSE